MDNFQTTAMTLSRGEKSRSHFLLSPKTMELALAKERMRCDRHGLFFSLIVIPLDNRTNIGSKRQLHLLAKLLHNRLRLTDEKGLLLKGGLGVLLPMTELRGARIVLNSILLSATESGLTFEAEIFSYSGRESTSKSASDSDCSLDSETDIIHDHESSDDDTVVESPTNASREFASRCVCSQKTLQIVRADDESQDLRSGTGQLFTTSTVPSTHICRRYPLWKRCMDIGCALVGLAMAIPVILIAAIAIKLTSRGPVFFRQMRTGQFGDAFPIYKLRTMVVDAEELKHKLAQLNERDGPAFKIRDDPRVTTLGHLLRKTGMDELPQLWNVLVGHMAIVGPRPLPCNEDAKCKVWHRRRLDTKPGLTCFWQIAKSRKISFSDWMRMDLRYADKRTAMGDIRLMFKTAIAVFFGRVGH